MASPAQNEKNRASKRPAFGLSLPLVISATSMALLFAFEHDLRVHRGSYMASGLALIPLIAGIVQLSPHEFSALGGLLIALNIAETIRHPELLAKGAVIRIATRVVIVAIGIWITSFRQSIQDSERSLNRGIQVLHHTQSAASRRNALAVALNTPMQEMRALAKDLETSSANRSSAELAKIHMLGELLEEPLETLNLLDQAHNYSKRSFNLTRTVQRCIASVQLTQQATALKLEPSPGQSDVMAWGNEALISRAVLNLILDAIGEDSESAPPEPLTITVQQRLQSSYVQVPITNQTKGFRAELRLLSTEAIIADQQGLVERTQPSSLGPGSFTLILLSEADGELVAER
jgi:hypothetical protein